MTWTQAEIDDLVAELRSRRSDTTTVEVKAAVGGVPELGPTLSAFANMPGGGTILLGLDEENSFSPTGPHDLAGLEQAVASQARLGVSPPPTVDFDNFLVDGVPILVVRVHGLPLSDRPARHRSRAYLRQSDGDYAMSQQELAQIELQKHTLARPRSDMAAIPGSDISDLDSGLVGIVLKNARLASERHMGISDEQLLRRLNVVTASGEITRAGLYALGDFPQQFEPSLSITAAVQMPRSSSTRARDLTHLTGPIPVLLADALDWVSRNTHSYLAYDERGHGFDRPELPLRAVREIIANALIHRNLDPVTDTKRVEIRLHNDRLVISSPGGLWGVSEQQLGHQGGKSAVNLALYDICKLLRMEDGSRVIEGEGGGIREAMLALREAEMRTPRFIDTGVTFTTLLSRHTLLSNEDLQWLAELPGTGRLSSEQRAILAAMRQGTKWTNSMVRQRFAPLDSVEARRWLQQLVDRGFAEQVGSRGTAVYRLIDHGRQPSPTTIVQDELAFNPSSGQAPVVEPRSLGPNTGTVWDHLTQPMTFAELELALTPALSPRQIRYAINALRDAGHVIFTGRQGSRTGIYQRAAPPAE